MRSTIKQHLKHLSKEERLVLKELCGYARGLYNEALENIYKFYFTEGECFHAANNWYLLKDTSNNYKMLNSNVAQKLINELHLKVRPFFGVQRYVKSYFPQSIPQDRYIGFGIKFIKLTGNRLKVPVSYAFHESHPDVYITVPPQIAAINEQDPKQIQEIRIVPRNNASSFDVYYTYNAEAHVDGLDAGKAIALDLGVNNLITAVSTDGHSFIIDGKRLKSYNWWFNKEYNKLEIIKKKQHLNEAPTARQKKLLDDWNKRIDDYMNKSARKVIDYCLQNGIGIIVVGCNRELYKNNESDNSRFKDIPFGKLRNKLERLAASYKIKYIKQEETFTSNASFWDKDDIPRYAAGKPKTYKFSGTRTSRGLYQCADGRVVNADVNAALNILRKSNVVDLSDLYAKGDVDTPVRIRIE